MMEATNKSKKVHPGRELKYFDSHKIKYENKSQEKERT